LTVTQYNLMYDAIVREIRTAVNDVNHTIEFVGMSLEGHNEWDWWKGFLELSNHAEDVRDAVANGYASFHFYANTPTRTNVTSFLEVWPQLTTFLKEVDAILELRDALSPTTKLAVNEAGVIPPRDNVKGVEDSPPIYYNMVAAFYTVLWAELSKKGVDVVGSSQYCGCPEMPQWNIPDRQYPGVSMTNWTTGNGNPRYWALKLINANSGPGDRIVDSYYSDSSMSAVRVPSKSESEMEMESSQQEEEEVYIQGRITKQGQRTMILVNKSNLKQTVKLMTTTTMTTSRDSDIDTSFHVSVVDETTHDGPWKEFVVTSTYTTPSLTLKPFAVAVVRIIVDGDDDHHHDNDNGPDRYYEGIQVVDRERMINIERK